MFFIGQTDNGWRCPGCQNPSTVIPSLYKCFCGRVTNPAQLRSKGDMSVPHSCGEPCRKRLNTSSESPCQHKCPQLCHPGPCPPCPVMVTRKCPCGKSRSVYQSICVSVYVSSIVLLFLLVHMFVVVFIIFYLHVAKYVVKY